MQNRQLQTWLNKDEYSLIEAEWQEASRRIKNFSYEVKATKAKQPEAEIEAEDDLNLVLDDDDYLDLIDHGDI